MSGLRSAINCFAAVSVSSSVISTDKPSISLSMACSAVSTSLDEISTLNSQSLCGSLSAETEKALGA
ncbi:hypothetical protein KLK36_19620 [Vibrio anguillarum]|nr:hypothetical protein KLK36_19620 [Vibrio anguillarum]